MLTCTDPGKLVLVASLVISCSAIQVNEFIGYPFSSSEHRIIEERDDASITVQISESLLVNKNIYTAIHVSRNSEFLY